MNQSSAAEGYDILRRLREVMGAVFGIDPSGIGPEASATTVAEWDSVRHLQLMLALEDEFGFQFDTDELASLRSISQIEERVRAGSGNG